VAIDYRIGLLALLLTATTFYVKGVDDIENGKDSRMGSIISHE
jgi:hypothetical protein